MLHGQSTGLAGQPGTTSGSLDLPEYISDIFKPKTAQQPLPPSFEQGGLIGGSQPPAPQSGLAAHPSSPGGDYASIQASLQQNPGQTAQIRQSVEQAVQSGEITQQELSTMVSLAQTAMQSPHKWPQIRQAIVAEGLLEEAEAPPDYEQAKGMLSVLVAMGGSLQSAPQEGGAPSAALQAPVASYEDGGALPTDSPNEDGSIPITAHEGEFVIPQDAVLFYGTDKLNKMIDKARNPEGGNANGQ